ncbi:arginine-tRNA-protein transferase 1 [Pseudovirgaria hyperparasitica]|uniref:Arginyl-tRNA--protein transferase 1 n=1 Tax=Pseudovirgaria hyperparasitica TaxID=470096 RepID=A0A6A6WCR0_9PEZI|nr:arginine-tRNA-protein transferase 1 [Pseudovirgaria hyperparasitica]KAF2760622.1 arginine-tRNA-protein transferase 1 [Pseudovirgaria hyperparasitica]
MQAPVPSPESPSILTPAGYHTSSCGYCKHDSTKQRSPDSSASYYVFTKQLNVDHYQELVDRGWRRSGTLLYKQDVCRSCCPYYTIRLPVSEFAPSKDQRQALNKWNKFVLGDDYIKESARLRPRSREQKARERSSFDLAHALRESEYANLSLPPEPAHRFEVTLEPADFTEEKYQAFENYQRNVHREQPSEISRDGFRRFLCDSPLQQVVRNIAGKEQKLGSYHQCYRLDGQLIAIGVLDLLPHGVSSVYFLYHESVSQWYFGKLSALREAMFTMEGHYQFYYMGFYIHSCVKMRYKGTYKPQYVLDPESLDWNPLEGRMRALLDTKKYVSLSREDIEKSADAAARAKLSSLPHQTAHESAKEAAAAADEGASLFSISMPGVMSVEELEDQVDLKTIKVSVGNRVLKWGDVMKFNPGSVTDSRTIKGTIAELAASVGPVVSQGMIVKIR